MTDVGTLGGSTQTVAPGARAALNLDSGTTFGPYRIERLLGRGGMGEVYEAEHLEQQRRVALKLLARGLDSREELARFVSEGRAAAAINHPNTVFVYGSEAIDGVPSIAMELVPGGTLHDRVVEHGPLPVRAAVDAVLQVIAGLDAAYGAGLLHRDVKPANCFVDADGTVKVGDFGLAIPAGGDFGGGVILGTPAFAPPEQLQGRPLDVRSDIYSVGATLFCLLTGAPPIDDDHLLRLVERVIHEPAPPIRERRADVPKLLATAIARCLDKNPDGRPRTYAELADLIEPFSSRAPEPAPLGLRFVAYVMDMFLVYVIWFIVRGLLADVVRLPDYVAILARAIYFGVSEGIYGASVWKALCHISVVRIDRRMPDLGAACLRSALITAALVLPELVFEVTGLSRRQGVGNIELVFLVLMIGLMFSTARAGNGRSGLHEILSRTRTIRRERKSIGAAGAASTSTVTLSEEGSRIGPYVAEGPIGPPPVLLSAYDPLLRRSIWLFVRPPVANALGRARCELRRRTRVLWLNGGLWNGMRCEAFEAPGGQSFTSLVRRSGSQPWQTVRAWITNLAEEIEAGLTDGTLPALSPDCIWVDGGNRIRVLDWPSDKPENAPVVAAALSDVRGAQRFLAGFASEALIGGRPASIGNPPPGRLPVQATELLRTLAAGGFRTAQEIVSAARHAAQRPTDIARASRVAQLVMAALGLIALQLAIEATFAAINAWLGSGSVNQLIANALPMSAALLLIASTAALTRGGIGIRVIGGAVVTADGSEASRGRAAARAVIAWAPLIVLTGPMLATWSLVTDVLMGQRTQWSAWLSSGWMLGAALLCWTWYAMLSPARDWHDRLARTWLVPR